MRTPFKIAFVSVVAALAIAAGSVSAAAIPISDVYCHNEKDNYTGNPGDMINGSGMNGTANTGDPTWPTGQGDPSTWTATDNNYRSEWQSQALLDSSTSTNSKIGWAIFDLGSSADLADLYIWNERENSGRYTATFNVYVAATPTNAVTHGPTGSTAIDYDFASGGWTLINTAAVLTGTYQGDRVVALNATGQYVGVEILSNGGDPAKVGLAEVAITPEPATLALLGIGGLVALRRRRRV